MFQVFKTQNPTGGYFKRNLVVQGKCLFPLKRLLPSQHWFWAALSSWLWLKGKAKELREGSWAGSVPVSSWLWEYSHFYVKTAGCSTSAASLALCSQLGTPGTWTTFSWSWGAQGSCNFEGFFLEMQDWGEFGKSGSQTDLEKLGSGSTVGRKGVRESSEPSPRKGWEHIPGNAQGQGMGHRLHTEQKEGRFSLQGPAKSPDTKPGWPGSFFHDSRIGQQCRIHTDNQP